MVGLYHQCNGHELEQTLGDGEGREARRAAVHGVTKSRTRLRLSLYYYCKSLNTLTASESL